MPFIDDERDGADLPAFAPNLLDHTSGDLTKRSASAGGSDRPFHRGKYNNA